LPDDIAKTWSASGSTNVYCSGGRLCDAQALIIVMSPAARLDAIPDPAAAQSDPDLAATTAW
jgi:hypothetical protein